MTGAIPILLYHSVDRQRPKAYARWVVTPACFEAHLSVIRDEGYRPMTVEAFALARASGKTVPARTVIITFDDGLADFLDGAMPSLLRFGFPATLYVTSGYVGGTARWLADLGQGDRPMLAWDQIAALGNAGIEIGAHSITHPQLDLVGRERVLKEILGCRDAIEGAIGRPIRTFAYPHGYTNSTIKQIVSNAGFIAACGVRHALSSTFEDLFGLSRIIVEQSMGPKTISRFLAGEGLPVAPISFQPAVFGWRQARRVKQIFANVH